MIGGIVGAIMVLYSIGQCGGGANNTSMSSSSSSSTTRSAAPAAPAPPQYTEADYEAGAADTCKQAVQKNLKDPESVRYGDDWKAWRVKDPAAEPDNVAFNRAAGDAYFNSSGSVNAKNSFGGYVGEQLYFCEVVITRAGNILAHPQNLTDLLTTAPTP